MGGVKGLAELQGGFAKAMNSGATAAKMLVPRNCDFRMYSRRSATVCFRAEAARTLVGTNSGYEAGLRTINTIEIAASCKKL
jgi:hypothetical protein